MDPQPRFIFNSLNAGNNTAYLYENFYEKASTIIANGSTKRNENRDVNFEIHSYSPV